MKPTRLIGSIGLAAILASTSWLSFSSYFISQTLFPSDGTLVIAGNEAELKVADGTLNVLSGSAGMITYGPALVPAMLVPFGLILAFAMVGAFSLIQNPKSPSEVK